VTGSPTGRGLDAADDYLPPFATEELLACAGLPARRPTRAQILSFADVRLIPTGSRRGGAGGRCT
jgi:hypothetical protein